MSSGLRLTTKTGLPIVMPGANAAVKMPGTAQPKAKKASARPPAMNVSYDDDRQRPVKPKLRISPKGADVSPFAVAKFT